MVTAKKVIHYLSYLVYALIIIYLLICIPIIFKYKPLVVLSGSMKPTYSVGSIIYYKNYNNENLKVGDIITYRDSNNDLVTHRIVKINNDQYRLKGDNNNTEDIFSISKNQIVGIPAKINIKLLGYLINFINRNMVISILFAIIVLASEFILSNINIKEQVGE